MFNLLTDISGLAVGNAQDLDLASGVTVVTFDTPAIASGFVLGGAPGSREQKLLEPGATVEAVDAFVLGGGSAFGLDAAGGVQSGLRADGRGFLVGDVRIPIVPQAILMDLLNGGNKDWGLHAPYRDLGYQAYRNAHGDAFALGTVGAGTGATTATLKGGLGSASLRLASGHIVGALVAVNAMGSITVGDGRHFWAAPFERDREFGGIGEAPAYQETDLALRMKGLQTTATTIGVIVTDAALTKAETHRLAIMAHGGFARAIYPAHLPMDGDTVLSAATCEKPMTGPADFAHICHAAMTTMARAIARGVYHAKALPQAGAQKAWCDL
ncbi:P1 family peptidase [Martelella sp. HB161492]|uniref:P1 family peptidase n=1 Tax=Martelella sp. HB161492 TaxID=2720726 RepID=UPI001591C9AA|nr:P1 family peptidase [Martelella sp. HB161492]